MNGVRGSLFHVDPDAEGAVTGGSVGTVGNVFLKLRSAGANTEDSFASQSYS